MTSSARPEMDTRRWWRRLAGGLVVFAAFEIGLELLQTDPDPLRLALLVAAGVGVLGVLVDGLATGGASWDIEVERAPLRERGDPRLRHYLSLIDAHLAARSLDTALRDRLGALTTRVLAQRYGVQRGDPRAAELMGPELAAVVDGPARRLDPAEIDRCLTRIEEL